MGGIVALNFGAILNLKGVGDCEDKVIVSAGFVISKTDIFKSRKFFFCLLAGKTK